MIVGQHVDIYTYSFVYKESESEVNKTNIQSQEGKNQKTYSKTNVFYVYDRRVKLGVLRKPLALSCLFKTENWKKN